MADPDANVIYGIVTDESMGTAVKVTVIATGFGRGPRKAVPTPVDLANYMNTPQSQAATARRRERASTGRRPNAKAAAGGGRFDLDVPAFLRRKGGDGGGSSGRDAVRARGPLPGVPAPVRDHGHGAPPGGGDGGAYPFPLRLRRVGGRLRPGQREHGTAGGDGENGPTARG